MSCGQIALRELGVKVDKYFASEIDKHAIAQTQLNFPETIQLGSVTEVKATDLPPIDLLIDGSGQNVCKINHRIRRLTPVECSRLQTVPSWYNWGCSKTQIYKMLGNGWTVEVIKHIFQYLAK